MDVYLQMQQYVCACFKSANGAEKSNSPAVMTLPYKNTPQQPKEKLFLQQSGRVCTLQLTPPQFFPVTVNKCGVWTSKESNSVKAFGSGSAFSGLDHSLDNLLKSRCAFVSRLR